MLRKAILLSLFSCISYSQHVFIMSEEGKCSGYKLNDNTVLTAKHCVNWFLNHRVLEDTPNAVFESYEVSRTDILNDLAILVKQGQKELPIKRELFGQAKVKEKVCSYGHAGGMPELTKMCDIITEYSEKNGTYLHGLFLMTKYKLIKGMSGGAALNEKNQIVGVNSFVTIFDDPIKEAMYKIIYPNMGYSGIVASEEIISFVFKLEKRPLIKYR